VREPSARRLATLRVVVLVLPAALMIATGVLGLGRAQSHRQSGWDMRFLYTAGRAWLAGRNPYQLDTFTEVAASMPGIYAEHLGRSGFAYMPQSFPLCVALGALPLRGATLFMTLLNLVSVGVVIAGCIRLATKRARASVGARPSLSEPWAFVAPVVLASPFTAQVLWLGQTSLLTSALVLAAWGAKWSLLASLALLFLPQRLLSGLDLPEGLRWREAVVLGHLAWLLWPRGSAADGAARAGGSAGA
jgi:hypothetical protein